MPPRLHIDFRTLRTGFEKAARREAGDNPELQAAPAAAVAQAPKKKPKHEKVPDAGNMSLEELAGVSPRSQPAVLAKGNKEAIVVEARTYWAGSPGLPDVPPGRDPVLTFWKAEAHAMPNVARLARRLLALPSSTADLERLFSLARLLSPYERAQMDLPRVLELRAPKGHNPAAEEGEEEEEKEEDNAGTESLEKA